MNDEHLNRIMKEAQMKVVTLTDLPAEPFEHPLFTNSDVTRQDPMPDSKDYVVNVVHFGKGVRLKFHAHGSEQLLIVTAGRGIVATENEQKVVVPGDVILVPAGEKHWHGATDDSTFSHIYVLKAGSSLSQLED
jgi:quercetin dioxygenase-like cupin family protein